MPFIYQRLLYIYFGSVTPSSITLTGFNCLCYYLTVTQRGNRKAEGPRSTTGPQNFFLFLNHSVKLIECSEMGTLNNLVPAFIGTGRNKTSRIYEGRLLKRRKKGRRQDILHFFPVLFLPVRELCCRTPFPACTQVRASLSLFKLRSRTGKG